MIPLNIIVTDKDMPAQYIAYLQKYNPKFNIHFFNDLDCRKLITDYFPSLVLQAYDQVKPAAYKADLFRYCALQVLGGIYTDTYIPYGKSFSEFWDLSENKIYLVKDAQPDAIQVATMASPMASAFMSLCMKKSVYNILNQYYGDTPFSITGPEMAGECFKKYTGQPSFGFGEYPCDLSSEASIQIDYRLVKANDASRNTVTEAVYLGRDQQLVCSYKENKHRNHRKNKDYYWHAWKNRVVYGEGHL